MTKIDIISGFLGAGKTTLIKKLIAEAYAGEKLVLIENEFGEIGIDGGFLQDAGISVTEMNSGCICCSLVGDFGKALAQVLEQYSPDRIVIEPSGVGKLSDVIRAVENLDRDDIALNCFTTVVDAAKCKMYMKNFGEFFNNQVEHASAIILSHTDNMSEDKLAACVAMLREHNESATVVATPWNQLDGRVMLATMEAKNTLEDELARLAEEHEHHHHHHEHGENCDCGCHDHEHHHHHEHDENCDCGCHDHEHHHHHEHDENCDCGCHDHEHHHHHHEHDEDCDCGCHDHEHHHHHHHHADEVFTSWGKETTKKFTADELKTILNALTDYGYGIILRAKGIVAGEDGEWIHFDYVPSEPDIRTGSAGVIGRLCVIGSNINEEKLAELFKL